MSDDETKGPLCGNCAFDQTLAFTRGLVDAAGIEPTMAALMCNGMMLGQILIDHRMVDPAEFRDQVLQWLDMATRGEGEHGPI